MSRDFNADARAEREELIRRFWIDMGMPATFTYEQGKAWAAKKQAKSDIRDEAFRARVAELERLIAARFRQRLLAAGFLEEELKYGGMPSVDSGDPRFPDFKAALEELTLDELQKFIALGCIPVASAAQEAEPAAQAQEPEKERHRLKDLLQKWSDASAWRVLREQLPAARAELQREEDQYQRRGSVALVRVPAREPKEPSLGLLPEVADMHALLERVAPQVRGRRLSHYEIERDLVFGSSNEAAAIDPEAMARQTRWQFEQVFGEVPETAQPPEGPAEPAHVLFGWPEILTVLFRGEKNAIDRKSLVARLNREHGGPIQTAGQGSQPHVVKSELVAWWDRMFVQGEACVNRSESRKETTAIQQAYGKTGTVATELGGSVKARRASKRRATS